MSRHWWGKHWQKIAAAAIWIALIGSLVVFMRANDLTLAELFLAGMVWVRDNPFAGLAYIFIYVIRPLTLFSSVLLTLAGGFLFGPIWGVIFTVVGANLSATVAFFVGRYFGQGVLGDEASGGLVQRYTRSMRENSFETVLIMRFIFLPYDLVNYLAGFLRIHYMPFLLATMLGSIPGTIAFVLLGSSLAPDEITNMFLTGELPALDWRPLAISAAMFVASILLSRYFKRRDQGIEPGAEARPDEIAQTKVQFSLRTPHCIAAAPKAMPTRQWTPTSRGVEIHEQPVECSCCHRCDRLAAVGRLQCAGRASPARASNSAGSLCRSRVD